LGTPDFGARTDRDCRGVGMGSTGELARAVAPSTNRIAIRRRGANARMANRMRFLLEVR
jgi:hypothetical protein